MSPLDLSRTRDLSALLSDGFRLWKAHFPVFFALALMVVAPVRLLIDGLWAGTLTDFTAAPVGVAAVVSTLADLLVLPVLITAAHVVAVLDLGAGQRPTLARSVPATLRAALPVAIVVALYTVAFTLGTVALILPGVWLSVRLYFGAQAVVVDGHRGVGALRHSSRLVRGQWWRTFGILLVVGFVSVLLGLGLGLLVGGPLALLTDVGALAAVLNIVGQAIGQSFTALVATLLFFDLRARSDEAPEPTVARPSFAPPRPFGGAEPA